MAERRDGGALTGRATLTRIVAGKDELLHGTRTNEPADTHTRTHCHGRHTNEEVEEPRREEEKVILGIRTDEPTIQGSRHTHTPTPFFEKEKTSLSGPSSLLSNTLRGVGRYSGRWPQTSHFRVSRAVVVVSEKDKKKRTTATFLFCFKSFSCFEKLFSLGLETRDRLNHHLFTRHVMLLLLSV